MNINDAKKVLRSYLLHRRMELSIRQRKHKSDFIVREFCRSKLYLNARTVAVYLSFGSEVSTDQLVKKAFRDGKRVLVPVTKRGLKNATFQEIAEKTPLETTNRGPLEPVFEQQPWPFLKIDLVVVPGLGYDRQNHRIGYGGGTYDRLLSQASNAKHIGFFFLEQYLPVLPCEKHDRALDLIFTA